jgi:hypothetical protein
MRPELNLHVILISEKKLKYFHILLLYWYRTVPT